MNSEWLKQDDWIDTVQWQEEELRMEIKNARIPIDKEGAEIMYSLQSVEVKFMTQLIANDMRRRGRDFVYVDLRPERQAAAKLKN